MLIGLTICLSVCLSSEGGVREEGEEGAGSGIPKVAGSGRKREKLRNIAQYFAIEKMQRGRSQGTGIKWYGKREV